MSSKLNGLHPTLAAKAEQLVAKAKSEGIDIIITQGLRTVAEQNALYAKGRTTPGPKVTNARGGYSYHNFGLAFDFAVKDPDGSINWTVDKRWRRVGAIGESLGLEWGGRWARFVDIPHFQLTFGLTLSQLRAGKRPAGSTAAAAKSYVADGDSGAKVVELQTLLKTAGFNVVADGDFGPATLAAVKSFQTAQKLTVDGVAGAETFKRIREVIAAASVNKTPVTAGTYRVFTGTFGTDAAADQAAAKIAKTIGAHAFAKNKRVFTGTFTTLEAAERAAALITEKHRHMTYVRDEEAK